MLVLISISMDINTNIEMDSLRYMYAPLTGVLYEMLYERVFEVPLEVLYDTVKKVREKYYNQKSIIRQLQETDPQVGVKVCNFMSICQAGRV